MRITWVASLVIVLGTACGEGGGPPAASGPAAVAAPPPTAPAPTAPGTPAFLENAVTGLGHCDDSEKALFSCAVGGGRHVSLCTDDTLSQLQYRFGNPEFADIRAPSSSAVSAFHYAHVAWAQGEEHSVSFVNEATTYKVVSAIGGGGMDGEANNYNGVKVIEGGKEIAFVKCADTPAADYLMMLDGVLKPAAPAPEVSPAAWVGDWVKDDKILATNQAGEVKLMTGGEVVMSGPMEGEGLFRTAPLDGCGARLSLSEVGGDITLELNGPECPVEFAGTYINTVSP
jgi:hypothetical protein